MKVFCGLNLLSYSKSQSLVWVPYFECFYNDYIFARISIQVCESLRVFLSLRFMNIWMIITLRSKMGQKILSCVVLFLRKKQSWIKMKISLWACLGFKDWKWFWFDISIFSVRNRFNDMNYLVNLGHPAVWFNMNC